MYRYNNREGGIFPSLSDCWYQCFSAKNEVVRGQKNKRMMKKRSHKNDYQLQTKKKRMAKPRHHIRKILRNITRFNV